MFENNTYLSREMYLPSLFLFLSFWNSKKKLFPLNCIVNTCLVDVWEQCISLWGEILALTSPSRAIHCYLNISRICFFHCEIIVPKFPSFSSEIPVFALPFPATMEHHKLVFWRMVEYHFEAYRLVEKFLRSKWKNTVFVTKYMFFI